MKMGDGLWLSWWWCWFWGSYSWGKQITSLEGGCVTLFYLKAKCHFHLRCWPWHWSSWSFKSQIFCSKSLFWSYFHIWLTEQDSNLPRQKGKQTHCRKRGKKTRHSDRQLIGPDKRARQTFNTKQRSIWADGCVGEIIGPRKYKRKYKHKYKYKY